MHKIPGVKRTPFEGYWISPQTGYCYSFDVSIGHRYDPFQQLLIQPGPTDRGIFTTFRVDDNYLFIGSDRYEIAEFSDKRAVLMPDMGPPLVLIKRFYED